MPTSSTTSSSSSSSSTMQQSPPPPPSQKLKTWERRLVYAKKQHRPKLQNWSKDGFHIHHNRGQEFQQLRQQHLHDNVNHVQQPRDPQLPIPNQLTAIDKISCQHMTPAQFMASYEKKNLPCIISGVPQQQQWSAQQNWTLEQMLQRRGAIGSRMFKVGEDDEGYKVKVRLRYFLRYMQHNTDDSPLYIFDSNFDTDEISKCLLQDYTVPSYFPEDYFQLMGEKRRPPYRWFLMGPERSGTCIHIDPLGTSAWNTVITGRKRWVLLPPEVKKSIAKGMDVIRKGEDDEMTNYVLDLLPRIKAAHPDIPILEFVQEAGDTVFVPGGWWHGVLNLDNTLAITQNYCSHANFDQVWRKTRIGRKKMSVSWLRRLHQSVPDLAQRAETMNQEDGFVMYDMAKRRAEKQEKLGSGKRLEKGNGTGGGEEEKKPDHNKHHHRSSNNDDSNNQNHNDNDNKKKSSHREKKRKGKDESNRHDDKSLTTTNSDNNNSHAQQCTKTEIADGNGYTRDMKKMRVQ